MSSVSLKTRVGNFIEKLVRVETIFTIVILGIMALLNTVAIFLRAAFRISLVWINPLTLVLFSWLTFIGAAIIFYHKEYIVVEYFVNHFFSRARKFLALSVNIMVISFLIFVIYEMPGLIKTQTYKLEILPLPAYVLSLPILIGIGTVLLLFVYQTWDMLEVENPEN